MDCGDKIMIPYKIKKILNEIKWWWNPRQKWLIKKIPNHWIDKDTLWEICVLEGIKHYVEKDGGGLNFEESDPLYPEWQKIFDKEVKKYYNLITKKLPELEKELKEAWEKIPHFRFVNRKDEFNVAPNTYEKTYGEVDCLEKEIYDLKTEIMIWAVNKRDYIWT